VNQQPKRPARGHFPQNLQLSWNQFCLDQYELICVQIECFECLNQFFYIGTVAKQKRLRDSFTDSSEASVHR
jgi:hypothetical protein